MDADGTDRGVNQKVWSTSTTFLQSSLLIRAHLKRLARIFSAYSIAHNLRIALFALLPLFILP